MDAPISLSLSFHDNTPSGAPLSPPLDSRWLFHPFHPQKTTFFSCRTVSVCTIASHRVALPCRTNTPVSTAQGDAPPAKEKDSGCCLHPSNVNLTTEVVSVQTPIPTDLTPEDGSDSTDGSYEMEAVDTKKPVPHITVTLSRPICFRS